MSERWDQCCFQALRVGSPTLHYQDQHYCFAQQGIKTTLSSAAFGEGQGQLTDGLRGHLSCPPMAHVTTCEMDKCVCVCYTLRGQIKTLGVIPQVLSLFFLEDLYNSLRSSTVINN